MLIEIKKKNWWNMTEEMGLAVDGCGLSTPRTRLHTVIGQDDT